MCVQLLSSLPWHEYPSIHCGLPVLQYVSLDRIWSVPDCPSSAWETHCPLGVHQFLEALWEQ